MFCGLNMLDEDAEYLQYDSNHEDGESIPTVFCYQISDSKEPRETIITFPDEVEEFSDTEIKFMRDGEKSEGESDTIVKTEVDSEKSEDESETIVKTEVNGEKSEDESDMIIKTEVNGEKSEDESDMIIKTEVDGEKSEDESDTIVKTEVDGEKSEDESDTIVKTEDETENAESSDQEHYESRVYLECVESENESVGSELRFNSVIETSSLPESEEPDPEELKSLVEYYKTQKFPHCYVCDLTVRTSEQLNEHSSIHNSKEIVICEVCKNIIHKDLYKTHLKVHRELFNKRLEKKYQKTECTVCGKYVSKTYMKVHLLQHGTEEEKAKRFKKCMICNADISVSYLTDHMKRVHMQHKESKADKPNNKLKCPVCFRMFRESTYKNHVASHASTRRKYICEECGREFFSKSTLSTHALTHKEVYKYKCQFCPYRGKHLGLLKVHVRTHTKDYSYKCDCGASFITKSNLNAHEKTHHSAYRLRFICSQCGKSYSKERTLQSHIESIHEGIKAYACNVCGKKYGTKVVMTAHKKRVHNIVGPKRVGLTPSYLLAAQGNEQS